MEFGHVGELHGEVFVGFFGLVLLAIGPEQIAKANLGEWSGLVGGELVHDALKDGLRLLAFADGVELGAETEQRVNEQGMRAIFAGEFLQRIDGGGFFVLIPEQVSLQKQRIGSGVGACETRDDKIAVLDGLRARKRLSSLVGIEGALIADEAKGDDGDHHEGKQPDKLAEVVLQKFFRADGGEFLRDGIEL